MNKILTIYDMNSNNKTGKSQEIREKYNSCILSFKENTRIHYLQLKIIDGVLYNFKKNKNKIKINLNEYNIVIFNYNEDINLRFHYLGITIPIYVFIKNKFKHLTIFNNLLNHDLIIDTFITYNKFKNSKFINVPVFSKYLDVNKINSNHYPILISYKVQCGGNNKYLIKNVDELKDFIQNNKSAIHNNSLFWAKFYQSPSPFLKDYYISLRLFIFSNILVDFNVRISLDWNCRVKNTVNMKNSYIKHQYYFRNYINKNKNYVQDIINELYDVLGDGLYGHDFILVNDKLVLCELGYKVYDQTIAKRYGDLNTDNICNNTKKTHLKYKELLLTYN